MSRKIPAIGKAHLVIISKIEINEKADSRPIRVGIDEVYTRLQRQECKGENDLPNTFFSSSTSSSAMTIRLLRLILCAFHVCLERITYVDEDGKMNTCTDLKRISLEDLEGKKQTKSIERTR